MRGHALRSGQEPGGGGEGAAGPDPAEAQRLPLRGLRGQLHCHFPFDFLLLINDFSDDADLLGFEPGRPPPVPHPQGGAPQRRPVPADRLNSSNLSDGMTPKTEICSLI